VVCIFKKWIEKGANWFVFFGLQLFESLQRLSSPLTQGTVLIYDEFFKIYAEKMSFLLNYFILC
jgi:hypothetical protein